MAGTLRSGLGGRRYQRTEQAFELYRKAEAIDDQYALLAFRMARCCDLLGNTEQAATTTRRPASSTSAPCGWSTNCTST